MKYIAQIGTPPTVAQPSYPRQTGVSFEVLVSLVVGGVGALGLPKLIQAFAAEKIKTVESERRRDDGVYQSLTASQESMLKAMTQMNSTMMAGQSSSTSESFQLMSTLVQELALLREVVSAGTEAKRELSRVIESLALQSHESYGVILELSNQVQSLKSEVMQLTRKT
jgi:uncharacterized protein (UPF0147 family)